MSKAKKTTMMLLASYPIWTVKHVFNILTEGNSRQLVVSENRDERGTTTVQWVVDVELTHPSILAGLEMDVREIAGAVREYAEKKLDVLVLE